MAIVDHAGVLTMCLLLFVVVCCVQDVLHQVAELHCLWTEAQRDFVGMCEGVGEGGWVGGVWSGRSESGEGWGEGRVCL